jgi:hypothetical protein
MEEFLSAETDEEVVVVAAKIDIILINVWLGNFKLDHFPSILLVDCKANTLFEISKCYKKIFISSCLEPEERIHYIKKSKIE